MVVDAHLKNRAGHNVAEPRDDATAASGSRRRASDAIYAAQVREVGTAFLRARPLVVAPVAAANVALVIASGASIEQRIALAAAIGSALAAFVVERWWLARARVTERWLEVSLALTAVLLALGCALSGGVASPLLPLVVAPVVVAAAAFGRTRATIAISALGLAAVIALAVAPSLPAIADPWSRAMLAVSFAGLLALAYAGVAGLVGAYVRGGRVLEQMRVATLEEAANRMRATEQVGAKVAHELKNPLAAIKALLQILRDRVDERGLKRLEVALAEVDRMDGIVRDYLEFARPLAELELAAVDLRAIADDVASVLADRAAVAGVELAVRGEPSTIRGDARRLREAIFNLTDNAIAATPAGGSVAIEISARAFRVVDTGTGMPDNLAPFATTREGGTGLGIAIARGAVTQHGGELAFTSRPGGGTIATVTLPEPA
jgi:signal transduction histidine kinase